MRKITLFLLSLAVVVFAILCAKFFAVAEYGFDMSRAGNMSLFGGFFGMPILYYLIAKLGKRDMRLIFDVFGVCAVVTVLFARCNCLISGCCLGQFIGSSSVRWPTREIEVIYYISFLVYAMPRILKKRSFGEIYPLYMLTYGVLRFIVEFLRVSETNNLFHLSHAWALIAIVIGLVFYSKLYNQVHRKTKKAK